MAFVHITRIARFLLVLSAVIVTILIYASYSSSTSLAPPHFRTVVSPSAVAAALNGQQPQAVNRTGVGDANLRESAESGAKSYVNGNSSGGSGSSSNGNDNGIVTAGGDISANSVHAHAIKMNKKSAASGYAAAGGNVIAKKQHREPTIDADAVGGGGVGGTNGVDDTPDEVALERFVNNDLLEEQYGQSIDNTMGNINNSASFGGPAQSQQLSPSQQLEQQPQQQQHVQLVDNNLNKILDSDVLIPTSNLQKFIENADKILKNITAIPPTPTAPIIKPSEKDLPTHKIEEQRKPQQSPSDDVGADSSGSDDALPPSVVMNIKRGNSAAAAPAAAAPVVAIPAPITTKTYFVNKAKTVAKSNTTVRAAPIDPSRAILTQQIYESGHMDDEIDIKKLCPYKGADLKLLILITSAQSHTEARLAIRQTWAHFGIRRDVTTAFILGRTTNETLNKALAQENFIYGDLIRGNFIDSYNNLTLKTISALEWVDKHCSRAKYVLKTDDDMFINVPKLLAFLDSHSKEKRVIYGRLAKKWKPIRNKKSKYFVSTGQFNAVVFPPFTTGPAYVMSSDIIHELYGQSLHQVYLKLEDVFTTGIIAQQLGIKRVHVNEFLNRRIAFNPCNIRKTISVHMIKANEQFDLWKKLLDQTTKCK